MAITISDNSKELVTSLIKKEFHAIDFQWDYIDHKAQMLIKACMDFGLWELANELNEIYEFEINNL
jgi:hypothetical protein